MIEIYKKEDIDKKLSFLEVGTKVKFNNYGGLVKRYDKEELELYQDYILERDISNKFTTDIVWVLRDCRCYWKQFTIVMHNKNENYINYWYIWNNKTLNEYFI